MCRAHGGGKRCRVDGCDKHALARSDFCRNHGVSKRHEVSSSPSGASTSTAVPMSHFVYSVPLSEWESFFACAARVLGERFKDDTEDDRGW